MTTREELIDGIRMIVREGLRTTAGFGPDDWSYQVHGEEGGWTAKQVYCHLVGTAEALPGFLALVAQAGEGTNPAAGLDIDSFNAQGVASREGMSEADLMQAFQSAHEKAAEVVQALPQEQIEGRWRFGAAEATGADLIDTFFVLHGLAHVYNAQSRSLA